MLLHIISSFAIKLPHVLMWEIKMATEIPTECTKRKQFPINCRRIR